MASASSTSSLFSKEKSNFTRLSRLLINYGTQVLKCFFDKICLPSTLHTLLYSPTVHRTLQGLRARRILNTRQWARLYPATIPVTSQSFDITLLFLLLRNICGLTPPSTGWDNHPVASDISPQADLLRIKLYRNELYHSIITTTISDSDFEKYWKDISDVLVRLGGPHYQPVIDRLKVESLDAEEEKYLINKLVKVEEKLASAVKESNQQMMEQLKEIVPQEIIFRGAEAVKAYRQALQEGEVQVYRGRIMLIGQDRAGKTSLKKSILGISFDPKEPSTDGVDLDPSTFSVHSDDTIDWQITKDSDRKMEVEDGVVNIMVELINKSREAEEPELAPKYQKKEEIEGEKSAETSTEAYLIPHTNNLNDEASASNQYDAENSYVPETVMEKLIQRLLAKDIGSSSSQETTISIWDFAGQQLYYASHPVFFSHRAVYILVYNQITNLNAKAERCVQQGVQKRRFQNRDDETNLEVFLSWLVSVHSARPEEGGIRKKLPYLRPPVIIVGTHADCPFEEPNKMEAIIQEGINGKSYEQHVVRPFIAVDNTQSCNDGGVKKLKDKVKQLLGTEPYMGEKVPIRWFKFEQVMESLVKEEGKHHMPLQDIKQLVLEVCEIKDEKETSALLNFYHDLGVIVKQGNTVVLKAEWLIDLFKKLITIRPFNEQDPINSKLWNTLEQTGILEMDLIEHAFKDIINSGETKCDILYMMERYGLIARFGGNENQMSYFVPAQLLSSPKGFLDVEPAKSDPCTLYLHFLDGFIPHGLYTCLVSRMITWCSRKGYPHKPRLYQSLSQFFIGCTYRWELFLIRRKHFVKVVLRLLQTGKSLVFEPTAFQIRLFLESSLEEIKGECPWYQSLSYEISVRCTSPHARKCHRHQLESCPDDDCPHLLPIKDDRDLVCSENIGKESKPEIPGMKGWYREHPMVPEHSEEPKKECIRDLDYGKVVYNVVASGNAQVAVGPNSTINVNNPNARNEEGAEYTETNVTSEIIARGPKAQEAYQQALKEGKSTALPTTEIGIDGSEQSAIAICPEYFAYIEHDILTISADIAAEQIAERLQLDKTSLEDPPAEIVKNVRCFCVYLKEIGRLDIMTKLRTTLPSGMTGPSVDEKELYERFDSGKRKILTQALCGDELWKRLADEFGISNARFSYFDRKDNPVEAILEEVCKARRLTVGDVYDIIVKCGAAALADKYM